MPWKRNNTHEKNNYDKITSDRKTGNKKYISNKTV